MTSLIWKKTASALQWNGSRKTWMIGVLVAVMVGLAAWAGPAVPTRRPVASFWLSA